MAKTVNLGLPYTHRVTLRLNEQQFGYVTTCANMLGISPSDYLRMVINLQMSMQQDAKLTQAADKAIEDAIGRMVGTHEDVKTDGNDIVQQ